LKADAALKHIPVIVLSGSDSEENVSRCYGLSANCFVAKHEEWRSFVAAVKQIQQFWCGVANLPPRG
jgi:DNA-binding NarL/FixJ family response regulator